MQSHNEECTDNSAAATDINDNDHEDEDDAASGLNRVQSAAEDLAFSLLHPLVNTSSDMSGMSLSFEYVVACLSTLLVPFLAPVTLPRLFHLTEGHTFFQHSVCFTLAAAAALVLVVLLVTYTDAVVLPSELIFASSAYVLVAIANVRMHSSGDIRIEAFSIRAQISSQAFLTVGVCC